MTRTLGLCLAVGLAALAALAAPAGAQTAQTAQDRPSAAELEALYWARQRAALDRYSDADVRFMTGMIGHHAQALILSAMARTHGASPAVQRLAARIDNAQRDEIATMQRWLRDRGRPAPEVYIEGTRLMVHGPGGHHHHDHASMPGMLSDEQLAELDAARGAEFDRLFLAYMIQHHGGAVVMVDDLFRVDGAAQHDATFKLASEIQVDQRTEIARMQQMLDQMRDE